MGDPIIIWLPGTFTDYTMQSMDADCAAAANGDESYVVCNAWQDGNYIEVDCCIPC